MMPLTRRNFSYNDSTPLDHRQQLQEVSLILDFYRLIRIVGFSTLSCAIPFRFYRFRE